MFFLVLWIWGEHRSTMWNSSESQGQETWIDETNYPPPPEKLTWQWKIHRLKMCISYWTWGFSNVILVFRVVTWVFLWWFFMEVRPFNFAACGVWLDESNKMVDGILRVVSKSYRLQQVLRRKDNCLWNAVVCQFQKLMPIWSQARILRANSIAKENMSSWSCFCFRNF